jgi:hypothetical protein
MGVGEKVGDLVDIYLKGKLLERSTESRLAAVELKDGKVTAKL